jgi:hypothetical protein
MTSQKFRPDYRLIREWDKVALPLPPPFVAEFTRNGKCLYYIAASHEGGVKSATLRTVKYAFDIFKPDVVVVEGIPNTGETSPAWYLEQCRQQAESDFAQGGEGSYATVLAAERGIDFIPGEPSAQVLYEGLLKQGYKLEDLVSWHIAMVLSVPTSYGGAANDREMREHVERCARNSLEEVGKRDVAFGFDDFCKWYSEKMGVEFSVEHVRAADCFPSDGENANFLQKMMAAADRTREPHIVKIIAEQLNKYDRVLVVYGAAHAGKQEPVFVKEFGPPRHLKPA